jgi:hypothetical protein
MDEVVVEDVGDQASCGRAELPLFFLHSVGPFHKVQGTNFQLIQAQPLSERLLQLLVKDIVQVGP